MERKVWIVSIILFLCSLFVAGTAMADVYNQLPADYATWSGTIKLDKNWAGTWDGYYVGYSFNFYDTNSKTTYNELSSLCIDPSDYSGSDYYSIESLSTALNSLPTNPPATTTQYLEVAWLLTQHQAGVYNLYDTQVAAWQILGILTAHFPSNLPPGSKANDAYSAALSSGLTLNTLSGDIYVAVSPANQGLTFGSPSQDYMFCIPEPCTLFLFICPALGLLGLLGLEAFRKRFRAA